MSFGATLEVEHRYRLKPGLLETVADRLPFSQPMPVVDLTFGPHGAESMVKDGWVLRIRRLSKTVILELKGPTAAPDSWEEIAVPVGDLRATALILSRIGLKPGLAIARMRREATWHGARLMLDQVRWLGDFLEIERSEQATHKDEELLSALGVARAEPAPPYGDQLLNLLPREPEIASQHEQLVMTILEGDDAFSNLMKCGHNDD